MFSIFIVLLAVSALRAFNPDRLHAFRQSSFAICARRAVAILASGLENGLVSAR